VQTIKIIILTMVNGMGTLVPISCSCSVFVLGVYLMMRNASRLSNDLDPEEHRSATIFACLAFVLIMLSGIINKVLE